MIQGTASDVGKSIVTMALCRLLVRQNRQVVPFKSQNMSNRTYRLYDGKEISTSQALQAFAAKIEPTAWMNPIVLKPQRGMQSEIVMLGEYVKPIQGKRFRDAFYEKGLELIKQSLDELRHHYDTIILEGAGSPVEMNLRDKELVNMKIASLADVPVILVADIERGGLFASVVGTLALLTEEERRRVKGIIVNKLRGDVSLFTKGITWLEEKVNVPILGVIPYIEHRIDSSLQEDAIDQLNIRNEQGRDAFDELTDEVAKHLQLNKIIDIIDNW